MTQRKIQYWVIPPKENGQFVANMENVLGIYKRPYDELFPVVCMWAIEMRRVLTGRFASAAKVTVACDNLNTHVAGAFYETFSPSLLDRLDLQYTPKHGSWLNIAENELSSMTRQAMHGQRFATISAIEYQLSRWANATNAKQRGVDWQFTSEDARVKLRHLYLSSHPGSSWR